MLPTSTRIFVCTEPVDMRRSFEGHARCTRKVLQHDPASGALFIFTGKRGDSIKALWWDKTGYAILYKRLSRGVFRLPAPPARLSTFVRRTIACQMTTYFVIGWVASSVLNYRELFGSGSAQPEAAWQYMRSFESPWVAAGPILQCVRGCLFGLVLWPLRALWIEERRGFLRVWVLFVGLAILGPTAAAPGSLEGIVYTNLSLSDHLLGLPETSIRGSGDM